MALAVTVPDTLEMIVGERLNLVVDFTSLIAAGDILSVPAHPAVVQSAATNETALAIVGVPFVSNSVILNITVSSDNLRPKTDYVLKLNVIATGGAGVKSVGANLVIKVIY